MSIVSTTIPNLVNGVSQQPYALRLASQAEEQINGYSSVVEGLRKRPPSRYAKKFLNFPLANAYIHTINRDPAERYTVVITNGSLRVFDLNGNEKVVTFPNGVPYLSSSNPQEDFSVVTVADYTFVLNKRIVVQQTPELINSGRPKEALIWVKQGAYSTNYSVTFTDPANPSNPPIIVTHKTADASVATNAELITTDFIAAKLRDGLATALTPWGWVIDQIGSLIWIHHPYAEFALTVTDGIGDTAMKLVKGSVQRFSDLPAKGIPGFKCRIRGTNENAFDDYFVEFESDVTNPYGGVWKESVKEGEPYRFYWETMPHGLVRNADGTFTFKMLEWPGRKVGDIESCPMPSFVGKTLNDIFFHRNRLGLLAEENLVFSRSGEFFNFFKASAISTLDTDPIDVAVSHVKVSILRHAIPFNESLLLFSDQTQFTLGATELLTPRTISINQTTEFECSLRAKPVGAGQNVYFAVTRGAYTGIREYYVDGDTKTNDAADVTAHCPRYLPKGVVKLVASSNEDVLVALSENKRDSLYVYRYYWSNQEKLQSSWSRWDFGPGASILAVDFIESDLWMVVSRADGTYIEVVSLEPGRVDAPATFQIHLDRRVTEAQVADILYYPSDNVTHIRLPYQMLPSESYQLVAWYGDAERKPGQVVPFKGFAGDPTLIAVSGNLTRFVFGRTYEFRYRFSTLIIREDAAGGGGQQPIGEGRVQLRNMTLTYNNAGYFRAEVTPSYRSTYRYIFSGRIIGSGQNVIGQAAVEQGTFKFPVAAKNDQVKIELVNDTFLPSAFLSAEWEAFFQIRSKRL